MWIALTIVLALMAVLLVHWRWRTVFLKASRRAQFDLNALQDRLSQHEQKTELQQEALFNSMIEGVLLLNEQGRIQLANRAFTTLFAITTDVRRKTILEVLRLHELAELIERVAVEKQVLDFELKLNGGAERWLQINAAGVFGRDGRKQGTVMVFHDLTRIKQLERTREEFVANVSHELRTPLSLIKGYVETLLDGARDNPEVQVRFLETIQRNSERLQFLIEDLLTISQLESGRLKMNVQQVRLRPLTDRVLEDHRASAVIRKVQLVNELPDLTVRADAERVQQVLGNLIANGIRYGKTEGRIEVSGERVNGGVRICVRDDGPGIPRESLERVFERFYRVDKARSREQGGTGLGLSIVKHIVQCHGGTVWAASEPGKGAAFYFTLPAGEEG